jgi:hypothetical protein
MFLYTLATLYGLTYDYLKSIILFWHGERVYIINNDIYLYKWLKTDATSY